MHTTVDVAVIGAGQAGLAAGYHLRRAGLRFVILEAASEPGGSWSRYYDSLTLFSPARYSSLPGLSFDGHPDRYPTRDEVTAYLRGYAAHFELPIVTGAAVEQIERVGDRWLIRTRDRGEFVARSVIAATGSFDRPLVPTIAGDDAFCGEILHAFRYQNAERFRGQRIVVVGAGNSAVQIAAELARVARVTLATRQPVRFVRQRILGRDLHFWLRLTGIDRRPDRVTNNGPRVLDDGRYHAAFRAGLLDRRAMFECFTETGVIWADGTHEPIDTVIFATGYQPNLAFLAATGALDADGCPIQRDGISLTAPGVYFVGLSNQRALRSATLRGVGADAEHVVKHLRTTLRTQHARTLHPLARLRRARAGSCCEL